jgi:hypothetical protein
VSNKPAARAAEAGEWDELGGRVDDETKPDNVSWLFVCTLFFLYLIILFQLYVSNEGEDERGGGGGSGFHPAGAEVAVSDGDEWGKRGRLGGGEYWALTGM